MADSRITDLTELSVPALDDWFEIVDKSDTTDDAAGSSRKVSPTRLGGLLVPAACGGRLTLESGVAVSTSDKTAKTSVYFTPDPASPWCGRISLYDGTRWRLYSFSELTQAIGTVSANLPHDIFAYDNSGTITLEQVAWTNATARATALTTQDGIYVKNGATTRRYLGTYCSVSTTTTEDSETNRLVWNMYNRVPRMIAKRESTDSWTYTTAAFRERNGGSNRIGIVVGVAGENIFLTDSALSANSTANLNRVNAIGYDSTSAKATESTQGQVAGAANSGLGSTATLSHTPGIGYHFYAALEYAIASGTATWYGDAGQPSINQTALVGTWRC